MMKRLLMLIPVFLLSGCLTSVPVKRNFPDVPKELLVNCPELTSIEDNTEKLSEVLKVVTANYGKYHECKISVETWIEWYNTQKKIFEDNH
jgi:hypothetical protein